MPPDDRPVLLELYLIRHGIAMDAGAAPGRSDESRALTEEGVTALRRVAQGLSALGVTWDVIFTSGLVRARQTAEVLARDMDSRAQIVHLAALEPSGSPDAVIAELARSASLHRRVAMVGHEPSMGKLAARLLQARAPLSFKKGGVCRIDCADPLPRGAGVLRWFAPPKILRRLGR